MNDQAKTAELFTMWQHSMEQGLEAWRRLMAVPTLSDTWTPFSPTAMEAWARAMQQGATPVDALQQWKRFLDESVESWSTVVAHSMESEGFAKMLGAVLEQYLAVVGPLRQAVRTTGEEVLRAANLPSRAQITSLAAQVVAIDARLETMEERLDELIASLASLQATTKQAAADASPSPRPPRGARPPQSRPSRES